MFGRDPRIPLTEALKPRLRYLGNDDVILSLEALKNMYLIVTEILRRARGTGQHKGPVKSIITLNQLVTLKVSPTQNPRTSIRGQLPCHISQREPGLNLLGKGRCFPQNGTMCAMLNPCFKPMKQLNRLPVYDTFGRKGKLAIHPDNIPDTRVVKP